MLTGLLACPTLLQRSKHRICQRRESESQLMAYIRSLLPNQRCNWCFVPCHLHSKRCSKKAEAKRKDGAPSEWQQVSSVPAVKVVHTPAAFAEDDVLFDNYDQVDDGPVPDDAQDSLQGAFERQACQTPNNGGDDEAESHECDTRHLDCPRTQILSMQRERVVVWNVICGGTSACMHENREI